MVDSVDSAEEGWTLVTRKRKGKSKSHHPQIIRYKQKFIKSNRKKQWKKKKVQRAVSTTVAETFIQPQRTSITLWEFFPKSWQNDDQFNLDIVECHVANVEEPTKERVESSSTLMQAPEELNFGTCGDTSVAGVQNLTFSDEDLLLGSTPHNRPLFIAGYTREQRLNRMLVDGGSAVNILPLRVMKELGISMDELSHSRLMIQGFNQGGQRAIGVIRLNLLIDDMTSTALFHVIDARTSYNMLLGRPWIHENGVVPSTLHQCLKYCRDNEVRKVVADERPFTEAESHFADAKFYLARIVVEELQPIGTSSTNKLQRSDSPRDDKSGKIADHKKGISKPIKSGDEKCNVEASKNTTPVLRYVPKVRRVDNQALNGLTLPITNINQTKVATPISGFVRPTQSPKVEHGDLPSTRTEEGFDPNAYKLLAKAGYDPNESSTLGKLPPEANGQDVHGLNSTQKMLRQKGYAVQNSRAGLGFTSPAPARIVIKKSANYITAEEDESPNPVKPSVLDRLEEVNPQTSTADCLKEVNSRVSVFDRLGETKSKGSVFDRLGAENLASNEVIMTSAPRESVKNRLGIPKKTIEKKEKINVILEDPKDLRSKIPSRMKRHTTLIVTADEELKVKRQTVVVTKFSAETSQAFPEEENIEYSFHISASDGETQVEEEAEDAPPELEEGVKSTVDDLKEINLGTPEDPRPIYVSALLSPKEEKAYVELLTEYKDVFAWSYKEMPGLDPKVAVHHLAVKRSVRPIKQAQRRFRPELIPRIEAEVNKLIEAGFIREVKYPTWISSIVPVKKKNGQIRVCVDFRDLNHACPKDDFPLPLTELMVDATTGHEALSFMDGSSGYNQIRMAPRDEELTAFRTPKGIYCYKVMPFGLKNAGATYQRAMQKIFDDMLHKNIECYVDDLVVKSRRRADHLQDLRKVFDRLRRYQLKMNPLKCAFGVTSGKFLGFIVRHRGIEIDQTKIDAILKMPEPRNIHELKSLQGRLAYLRRFISNLAGRCQPFSRLMKRGVPYEWDEACSNAFKSIKDYLMKSPVLAAPIPGKPLVLYIAAQERSVGALLAQENEKGKENALYYLSRMMTPNELNYSPIEKMCLALVFAIQKLRHYFQAHTVYLISKANPVKYIMSKPVLSDRLARWSLLLQEFEIIYVPQKAVKGQALADFLADHPIPADWELSEELPDEDVLHVEVQQPWKMYFDGAAQRSGAGAGVVFLTPEGDVLPYAFTLIQLCSNNEAEYQALILGLEMAVDMKQLKLNVYGDSKLVINQLLNIYEVRKPELVPYYNYAIRLIGWLGGVTLEHVPRKDNKQADCLAKLASTLALPNQETQIPICQRWVVPPLFDDEDNDERDVNAVSVFEIEENDWRQPLIDYLLHQRLPEDPRRRTDIKRRASRFVYYKDTLYRRSFEGLFLRCLGEVEATQVLEEAHSGVCGAHQSGPKLHFRIKRMGYYWPTMVKDSMEYAKRCQACQFHGNFIHQPPEPLHPTVASWPFDAWGLDVVGPLPKSSAGHLYILAATDYFSKWAEAVPLREVKKENVVDFIRTNIIFRYGVPRYIITDNGKPFYNSLMNKLCEKFNFKQHNSSMYNAPANGLAEAFNKTLGNLLKKVVAKSKRDWHERIGEALWAYRTTYRTSTQATPYALVYGVEAVLPLECQIPSLRIALQEGLTQEENARLRLEELEALDEKRLDAQQRLECYQARLSRAFNKRVRPRSFQKGDLVLAVRRPIITTHRTGNKFNSKWDGPYVVQEVYSNGAYKIIAEDGLRIGPINGKFLKRYYP